MINPFNVPQVNINLFLSFKFARRDVRRIMAGAQILLFCCTTFAPVSTFWLQTLSRDFYSLQQRRGWLKWLANFTRQLLW